MKDYRRKEQSFDKDGNFLLWSRDCYGIVLNKLTNQSILF